MEGPEGSQQEGQQQQDEASFSKGAYFIGAHWHTDWNIAMTGHTRAQTTGALTTPVVVDSNNNNLHRHKTKYVLAGKAVWGKGYTDLLERLKEAKDREKSFHLDSFGSGEDEAEASAASRQPWF